MMLPSRPIHIFYHVCMINDWRSIVKEQLKHVSAQGLGENCKSLIIGSLGTWDDNMELITIVSSILREVPLKVVHEEKVQLCEFHTLKIMKQVCDESNPFYGFYFHTKGVSYPGHTGGKYWRDYMSYYNITRWKDCVQRLDDGNELCGVKLLTARIGPAHKLHYSGNFHWFRSEYIATLPPVESLDMTNRYNAEMWHGMNSPVAATMCQEFVDYNSGLHRTFIPSAHT